MVDKYRCYGKDDFGHPYDALSMKDEYGEWVRSEDYDALAAELAGCRQQLTLAPTYEKMIAHHGAQEVRIAELEAVVRELVETGGYTDQGGTSERMMIARGNAIAALNREGEHG
jgi:hypothetical protein